MVSDERDRLRCALASWPDVDPTIRAALGCMPHRMRHVVIRVLGEGAPRDLVAGEVGRSVETVARDLKRAARLVYGEGGKGV